VCTPLDLTLTQYEVDLVEVDLVRSQVDLVEVNFVGVDFVGVDYVVIQVCAEEQKLLVLPTRSQISKHPALHIIDSFCDLYCTQMTPI